MVCHYNDLAVDTLGLKIQAQSPAGKQSFTQFVEIEILVSYDGTCRVVDYRVVIELQVIWIRYSVIFRTAGGNIRTGEGEVRETAAYGRGAGIVAGNTGRMALPFRQDLL